MISLDNITINKDGIVKLGLTKKSARAKVQEVAKKFAIIPTTEDKNMKLDLPKTVTTKLYMVKFPATEDVWVTTSSMEHLGYVTIYTQEVTLDVPQEFDMDAATKSMKDAQRASIQEKYEASLAGL